MHTLSKGLVLLLSKLIIAVDTVVIAIFSVLESTPEHIYSSRAQEGRRMRMTISMAGKMIDNGKIMTDGYEK